MRYIKVIPVVPCVAVRLLVWYGWIHPHYMYVFIPHLRIAIAKCFDCRHYACILLWQVPSRNFHKRPLCIPSSSSFDILSYILFRSVHVIGVNHIHVLFRASFVPVLMIPKMSLHVKVVSCPLSRVLVDSSICLWHVSVRAIVHFSRSVYRCLVFHTHVRSKGGSFVRSQVPSAVIMAKIESSFP